MTKKRITDIILAVIFYVAFAAFTKAVMSVNLQAIGPKGSLVGFADFNAKCFSGFGQSDLWYEISEIIGWLALLVCAGFALAGVIQMIKRKSLLKVDRDIICLGVLYVLAIAAYVIFMKVTINCRPVLEADGSLESSYPSSHTMLGICVFASLLIEIKRRVPDQGKAFIGELFCGGMILLAVISRLLSGMHWTTDIIGGCILSLAFIFTFLAVLPASPCEEAKKVFGYEPRH